ncbi:MULTISPECIES: tyrosine-type recombinase/integrase [unclassified Virgibacillus]|uniref:tyrosine-type recombinase/integrase n=1 Tax=unclassified Virgibacillus TaxID=2620237 RepID=UPI0009F8ED40|nr:MULTISPECIES: tyrosine-type recombinase/integrase [unclassified Virgibacillus]MBS7430133.1 tyrosine-type recombinase/integrase [Virgibacillus sp. 19R1-5]
MSERKGKSIVRKRGVKPKVDRSTDEIFSDKSLNLSLNDALEYFVAFKKTEGVRKRTVSDYYDLFGYFDEWLSEKHPEVVSVNDCTPALIREYIIYLSEEKENKRVGGFGLSPYTINIRLRFLKVFFNVLTAEEICNKNPMLNIKLLRVDEDTFTPLSDDEIKKLLDAPDVREYAQFRDLVCMMVMLDCGIRSKEIFNLEIKDVDFKQRAIYLPASKSKNRKPRILPLSNQVLRALMELISEVKANFDTEYVFVSNFGERYQENSFRRRIFIYKNKANIEKRVTPHMLRHQFCRNYILNGGDIFTLQRIAGHAEISTTRKYIQMTDEDIKKQHAMFSPVARLRHRNK